jgi:predicted dehydrogenase
MENDIRVGIIGSGYIADFHAKAVQAIEGMELSAVVSPNRKNDNLGTLLTKLTYLSFAAVFRPHELVKTRACP